MTGYQGKNLWTLGAVMLGSVLSLDTVRANGLELTGTYTVPMGSYMDEPLELSAPIIEWNVDDEGTVSLEYALPYEIVGPEAPLIKLRSVSLDQPLQLRGDMADGLCRQSQSQMSCTIVYQKNQEGIFSFDSGAGLTHMEALNLDAIQMARVVNAQETLMHEAVGVLDFTLP
ncbi:MAG: hypothetical protein M3Q07_03575 [Pseudobdellovibrionaceae bacterium]|uniref:hypothetical protein n=1 Tax=Oligoflexus sp. TaxID=1971216 RepID=UPI0027C77C89|nr:hypothetical protein [Oligoflexus sp.]MDQ3230878.1 hypothetical protein [Pseudobdellovibrionaceae bacterium]HYX36390.1 hypothetical protein [Oligoflexus sp.]